MKRRLLFPLIAALLLAASAAHAGPYTNPGQVSWFEENTGASDTFESWGALATYQQFYLQHYAFEYGFSTFVVNEGSGNNNSQLYPNEVGYKDSSAVYLQTSANPSEEQGSDGYWYAPGVDSATAPYVLWATSSGSSGNPLFLNFIDGTYADEWLSNFGNPNYLNLWLTDSGSSDTLDPYYLGSDNEAGYMENAASWYINNGYGGLFLDDCNPTISSAGRMIGGGSPSNAYDNYGDWVDFTDDFINFVSGVRDAYPNKTLAFNTKYFQYNYQQSGVSLTQSQFDSIIQNCDYAYTEAEPNDSGVQGGTGIYSLYSQLQFASEVHGVSGNHGVFWGDYNGTSSQQREYALGVYFLQNNGHDALYTGNATPSNWWSGYNVNLGYPNQWQTPAEQYQTLSSGGGYYTRDFTGGDVIVVDPWGNIQGQTVGSILGVSSGSWTDVNGTSYNWNTPIENIAGQNVGSASTALVLVKDSPATPPADNNPAFITSITQSGSLRNNFTGQCGFEFTVGSIPIQVTSLGRWVSSGNTAIHTISLYSQSNENQPIASVNLYTAGLTANQFGYVMLGTPVQLAAGGTYYIMSSETTSGDNFQNNDGAVSTSFAGTLDNSEWSMGTFTSGGGASSYGPVNFKWNVAPGDYMLQSYDTSQMLNGWADDEANSQQAGLWAWQSMAQNEIFDLSANSDGSYTVGCTVPSYTGQCLNDYGNGVAGWWQIVGTTNEEFWITPTSDGYFTIVPESASWHALDSGGSPNTQDVQFSNYSGTPTDDQKWTFVAPH